MSKLTLWKQFSCIAWGFSMYKLKYISFSLLQVSVAPAAGWWWITWWVVHFVFLVSSIHYGFHPYHCLSILCSLALPSLWIPIIFSFLTFFFHSHPISIRFSWLFSINWRPGIILSRSSNLRASCYCFFPWAASGDVNKWALRKHYFFILWSFRGFSNILSFFSGGLLLRCL